MGKSHQALANSIRPSRGMMPIVPPALLFAVRASRGMASLAESHCLAHDVVAVRQN